MQEAENYNIFYRTIKRSGIIAQYFLADVEPAKKIKRHFRLANLLTPFKRDGLIGRNTFFIYLFSYLSRSFSVADKLQALYFHYSLLYKTYSLNQLRIIFLGGLECYREENDGSNFTIVLGASRLLEIEGSLSLYLKVDGRKCAILSFSFINGKLIGLANEQIAFISCLQQIGKRAELTRKAMKHFNDIIPAAILIKALEALCTSLDVKHCVGVTAYNQLSFKNTFDYEKYHAVYDAFWEQNGGKLNDGNYLIPFPLYQKDILSIKQTHRNRVRKKRQKLDEIYQACLTYYAHMMVTNR